MAISVRLPDLGCKEIPREFQLAVPPATVGALLAELGARYPDLAMALDSSSINAAVNGEVLLSQRDQTPLCDGDDVEFLVMFAGG